MKYQILFSGKINKNISKLSSAELAQRVVKACLKDEVNVHTYVFRVFNCSTKIEYFHSSNIGVVVNYVEMNE